MPRTLLLVACILAATAPLAHAWMMEVEPRASQCVYESVDKDREVVVELTVLKGGMFDIDFSVVSPGGDIAHKKTIVSNRDEETGNPLTEVRPQSYKFKADKKGEYAFCFANTMSRWTTKTITFDVWVEGSTNAIGMVRPKSVLEMTESLYRVGQRLEQVEHLQNQQRSRARRHKQTTESNKSRVLWFALLETVVLVAAAGLQLVSIRRWFKETVRSRQWA